MKSWGELGNYLYYILPFIFAILIGSRWNKGRLEKFDNLSTEERERKIRSTLLIFLFVIGVPALVCIYIGHVRGGDIALAGWILLSLLIFFLISFLNRERLRRAYRQEMVEGQMRTLVPLSVIKKRLDFMRAWSWTVFISNILFFGLGATLIGAIAIYEIINPWHVAAFIFSIFLIFFTGVVQSLLGARFETMRYGTTFMVHCEVCGKNSPFRVKNMPEISQLLLWQYIPLYFLYKTSSTAKYMVSCDHCGNSTK